MDTSSASYRAGALDGVKRAFGLAEFQHLNYGASAVDIIGQLAILVAQAQKSMDEAEAKEPPQENGPTVPTDPNS